MDAQMDTQVESHVEMVAMDDEYSTKDRSSWQPKPKHKKRRKSSEKRRKKKRKEKKGEPDETEESQDVQAHAYTKTAKMPVAKAVKVNVEQEEPRYTDIEDFYQVIDDELTTLRNAIVEHQTQMVDDASPLIWMVPHPPRSYITRLCCCTKCCGRCCDIYGHQKPVFHSRPKTAEVGTGSQEDDVRASTVFKDAKRRSSIKKEVAHDIKQDSIDASGCDSDVASGFRRPSKTPSWRSNDLEETELTLSGTSRSDEFTPKVGKEKALEVVQEAKRVLMDLKLLRERYKELKRARCDTPEDARKRDLEIGEVLKQAASHKRNAKNAIAKYHALMKPSKLSRSKKRRKKSLTDKFDGGLGSQDFSVNEKNNFSTRKVFGAHAGSSQRSNQRPIKPQPGTRGRKQPPEQRSAYNVQHPMPEPAWDPNWQFSMGYTPHFMISAKELSDRADSLSRQARDTLDAATALKTASEDVFRQELQAKVPQKPTRPASTSSNERLEQKKGAAPSKSLTFKRKASLQSMPEKPFKEEPSVDVQLRGDVTGQPPRRKKSAGSVLNVTTSHSGTRPKTRSGSESFDSGTKKPNIGRRGSLFVRENLLATRDDEDGGKKPSSLKQAHETPTAATGPLSEPRDTERQDLALKPGDPNLKRSSSQVSKEKFNQYIVTVCDRGTTPVADQATSTPVDWAQQSSQPCFLSSKSYWLLSSCSPCTRGEEESSETYITPGTIRSSSVGTTTSPGSKLESHMARPMSAPKRSKLGGKLEGAEPLTDSTLSTAGSSRESSRRLKLREKKEKDEEMKATNQIESLRSKGSFLDVTVDGFASVDGIAETREALPTIKHVDRISSKPYGEAPRTTTATPASVYYCETPFCVRESRYISSFFHGDPCGNFYDAVCKDRVSMWVPTTAVSISEDTLLVDAIDILVREYIIDQRNADVGIARHLLNTCQAPALSDDERLRDMKEMFNRYFGISWPIEAHVDPTSLDIWVVAGLLVRDLNLHLLATVSVDVHPEKRTRHMVGVDEPDLLYRRKFQGGRLADLVAASIQESLSLMKKNVDFDEIANTIKAVMVSLSKLVADSAVRYLGSENYRVLPLHQLDEGVTTLVKTVFPDSAGINVNTEVLIKSPAYFKDLATLGSLEPRGVLNYLGFRILVHFGTFISSSSLQQMRSVILGYSIDPYRPGIKEVCSREVEHALPPMYFRAFALRQQRTGFNTMARMWATQVEDSFRDGLSRLSWISGDRSNLRDSTDMHLARFKLSLSTLYHFYPPWIFDNKTYQAYVDDLRRELASVDQNRIVQLWRALLRVQQQQNIQQLVTGLVGRSITGSLFDTLPSYNAQKNSVFIPVAVMNRSIPARGSLFAFHIARFGVRIFRGLLPVIYNDFVFSEQKQEDVPMLFSDAYQKRLQETVQCLLDAFQKTPEFLKSNFLKNLADVTAAGFSFLEQTVALVQAFSTFQGSVGRPDSAGSLNQSLLVIELCAGKGRLPGGKGGGRNGGDTLTEGVTAFPDGVVQVRVIAATSRTGAWVPVGEPEMSLVEVRERKRLKLSPVRCLCPG
ncbi:hypothetical protein ISCGN_027631 [Ixodes scapularis]